MRIVGLIQARMNSQRLPGKVCMDLNGLPVLVHIYRRLLACKELDDVAVSIGELNSIPIADLCTKLHMYGDIGPERDLITRHMKAARTVRANAIVRVTADCPLIDPACVDDVAGILRHQWPHYDIAANWKPVERTWPDGLDCEAITMEYLGQLDLDRACPREDFMTYAITQAEKSRKFGYTRLVEPQGHVRMTLDTPEDHAKLEKILKKIGNDNWIWANAVKAMEGTV